MSDAVLNFSDWLGMLHDAAAKGAADDASVRETVNSMEMLVRSSLDEALAGICSLCFPAAADGGGGGDGGLYALLRASLQGDTQLKNLVDLRCEVLRFLEVLIEEHVLERNLERNLGVHILAIFDACTLTFRKERSNKVRELCFHPLVYCLDLRDKCPERHALADRIFGSSMRDKIRNPALVDQLWNHLSSSPSASTPTLRGGCFKLLGTVARRFPVETSVDKRFEVRHPTSLYHRAMKTLQAQTDSAAPKLPEVAGALSGLDGLLIDAELKPADVELVFEVVLKCLSVDLDEVKRYTMPRAALTCLGNNVPVFAAQTPALVDGEPAPSASA